MGYSVANTLAVGPTVSLGAAVNFLMSPVVLTLAAIAALTGTIYLFASSSERAAESTKSASSAAKDAHESLSTLASIKDSFSAGFIGTDGLDSIGEFKDSVVELVDAASGLGDAVTKPLTDAGFEFGSLLDLTTGLVTKLKLATEGVNILSSSIRQMTEWTKEGIRNAEILAVIAATGMSSEDAKKFLESRDAMRAAKIEAFELQKANEFAAEEFKKLTDAASEDAKKRGDIARIGGMTSIDAINKEAEAIEKQIAQMKMKGEYDKDAQKDMESVVNALERQRAGIENGTIVDKDAASAKQELAKAQKELAVLSGEKSKIDVAVENFKGTKEQADALRQTLEQIEKLTAKKEATKDAESQITKLKQEIDQLTGSSLAAKEALDKMAKDGVSPELTGEIERLMAEKERLKKSQEEQKKADKLIESVQTDDEKAMSKMLEVRESVANGGLTKEEGEEVIRRLAEKSGKGGGKSDNPFAGAFLAGSQEATSAITRAIGGGQKNPNAALEKFAQQQIDLLGQTKEAIVANGNSEPEVIDF